MNNLKLNRIIDCLSYIIEINQEQRNKLISNYSSSSEQDIIKDLAIKIYQLIGKEFPYYDYALGIIRNLNSVICPTVDAMKNILDNMFETKINGNMSINKNHELIKSDLIKYCNLFN